MARNTDDHCMKCFAYYSLYCKSGQGTTQRRFRRRTNGRSAMSPDEDRAWPDGTLLQSLSVPARTDLQLLGRIREFPTGSRLLLQGDTSTHVILLLEGCVKITADTNEGQSVLLDVRIAGDLVGELSALDGSPRLASVTAAGLVRARVVDQAAFHAFLNRHPAAAVAVSAAVAAKLRWSTRRRIDFGGYPVHVRLARVILELARTYGRPDGEEVHIGVELSQPEWAALIGASEPAVHRALKDLRQRGIVRTGYRQTVILQPKSLVARVDANQENTIT
jgi:CRP/FNR family transcriptional regulator, cyclic AMP receptor protein